MIAPEVIAHIASSPLRDLVLFVIEGLVGTAVVLILPAVVFILAQRHDRKQDPTNDMDSLLTNHFLDKRIERSSK